MRALPLSLVLILLFPCCLQEETAEIEYQCWDGTIVQDLEDCPPTTTQKATTTTTSTTTTAPCTWNQETCRMYCGKECGTAPLDECIFDEKECACTYRCGTKTTTKPTTTTTTLRRWLSEDQIDDAIDWGKENRFNMSNMLSEYSYPNYSVGYEHVVVYAPYLNLALAAAAKSREYKSLTSAEIDSIVTSNKVTFRVKLYGDTKDFASDVNAVIKLRDDIIQPSETTYDKNPETTDKWPHSPAYFAVNTYVFDDYERIHNRRIEFTVIKFTGEDVYEIEMLQYD